MKRAVRILIIDDGIGTVDSIENLLRNADFPHTAQRVTTEDEFARALGSFSPDIVLSSLNTRNGFSAYAALELIRQEPQCVPFIVVSGAIGEDRAVELIKCGATDFVLRDRLERLVSAIVRALKERRERVARDASDERFGIQHSIARVLAETVDQNEVAPRILQTICERMGFTLGALWNVDSRDNVLRCVELWHDASPALEQFADRTRQMVIRPGFGVAGQAWQHRMPVWIPGATINPTSSRARYAFEAKLQENFAFPISVQGKTIGLMDFFGPSAREPGPELLEVFATLGTQIGQFLERRTQHEKIARLNRIHAVLSGINSVIVRVRDERELFRDACRIAARCGQFGIVWIGRFDSATMEVTPLEWAGEDVGRIPRYATSVSPDRARHGLLGRAMHEAKPVFSNDILTDRDAAGQRMKEAARLGYRSAITLPLAVEGVISGAMTMYTKEPNFFDEEEVRLLTELADDISFSMLHVEKAEKLNHLAYYDILTGLPNRTLFFERVGQALRNARESGAEVALLVCDINRFRLINETFGRHAADAVLQEVGRRFKRAFPDGDNVARFAGNHFAGIVAIDGEVYNLTQFIERSLREELGKSLMVEGQEIMVSITTGIALFPADGTNAETLTGNAEAALKQAKQIGDPYLFYEPEMNARVAETIRLESSMRRALEERQFVLHYQPKLRLADETISGLEALIRWNDPNSGLVSPMRFIPLLEETGMIVEAGAWAIRQALADHREWRSLGLRPPRIAVNVSPIQLRQKDFVDAIQQAIAHAGVSPESLEIEITESLIMSDIDGNLDKLRKLRDLGINIAVDDFGTGYSSLSYLAKLPVNALKIDRSFITTMVSKPESMSIVESIISLAHSLKLKVIAEGVEHADQSHALKELGCDEIQGFLISPAIPGDAVRHLLRDEKMPTKLAQTPRHDSSIH